MQAEVIDVLSDLFILRGPPTLHWTQFLRVRGDSTTAHSKGFITQPVRLLWRKRVAFKYL